MFCSHCGAVIPDGSQFCPQCGGSCAEPQAPVAQPEVNVNDPQNIAKRTRDLKRLCAVLWIVIGILRWHCRRHLEHHLRGKGAQVC